MFHYFRTSLVFALLVLSTSLSFGQQSWPNTLLWRISGNGLARPSYLYGTMHLQDKRLFNFGDSLYKSLESVEGFAMEVDVKEFMDSMFMRGVQKAEEKILEEQKVKIDKKKLDRSTDSLFKKLGIDKNNVTRKDLKKIRDYRTNKLLQQGEMPTIVDGYLFGLALRQGKIFSGIEDVSDQLNLLDEVGGELTAEKVLESDASMRKGFEQMVQMYMHQDLDGINTLINGYDSKSRDALLTQRNKKMANRMDSLSAIRTMLFAVGTAHLPGDSGVIALLRSKGFTVEPVYSSQKIPAETYAKKLQAVPWYQVQDESKLYTIEMPGNPSQFDWFGEMLKMKIYFDITTMTFYMSSQTIGKLTDVKDFEAVFKNMADRMGVDSRQNHPKDISREGIKAMEQDFDKDEWGVRVQLLSKNNNLFMLMAGSANKAHAATADINRFFTSFIPHEADKKEKDWVKFSLPDKAFSVKIPGEPKRNKIIDKAAEGSNWNYVTYDYADNAKGLYYMLQIRDMKEGFFLNGDSAFFDKYVEQMKTGMDSILKKEVKKYKGYPALYLDALYQRNVVFKTMHVIRGSRVYSLLIGGQSVVGSSDPDTYFNSFKLDDYPVTEWKKFATDGFSTYAPSVITRLKADSTEGTKEPKQHQYVSYNPNEVISYVILKEPLPVYYWAKNDTSFFETRTNAYRKKGDSVLKKEFSWNGQLRAIDLLIQKPQSNNLQKARFFVNGDTLYTLAAFIPSQDIGHENHQRFFHDFRIDREITPVIYTNKANELLNALQSRDSLEFEKALQSFNAVEFSKGDLPALHKALLEVYNDSARYEGVQNKIMSYVEELADSSSISFVSTHYKMLPPGKERIQYPLLEVLAAIHTKPAYEALQQLLLNHLPGKGSAASLEYALSDSLQLTRTLYPDILKLSADSIFSKALVRITDQLLDSNLIQLADVLSYRDVFLQQARKDLRYLKKDQDKWWDYSSWISFLGKFNDKESNSLLQEFLKLPVSGIKMGAVKALAKNEQVIPASEMEKLAIDKDFRVNLYQELKALNKQHLFPVAYARQQSLGESEIYQIASDDNEVGATLFIGERTQTYQGKKKKFFLYKITLNFEDGKKESYLGVTGPYDPNAKELISFSDASGIYWDEQFDKLKTDEQFKAFIEQQEPSGK
jgi:uncharacterized protein YbaP (TraB family)